MSEHSAESDARRAGRPRTIERQIDPIVTALHRERVRQGLSQTALAQRMGLETYGTISEHERGVNLPNLHLLRRWSSALGLDVVLEPFAKAAQERYDAEHDPFDFHCLTDPCVYHPGETRIRPLPTFPAVLVTRVTPPAGTDA